MSTAENQNDVWRSGSVPPFLDGECVAANLAALYESQKDAAGLVALRADGTEGDRGRAARVTRRLAVGEGEVHGDARAETRFCFRTGITSVVP